MSFFKRYRRKMLKRALKPFTPLFVLDRDEVTAAVTGEVCQGSVPGAGGAIAHLPGTADTVTTGPGPRPA